MLRLNPKWGETYESLLQRSLKASNVHAREHFLALAMIASDKPGYKVAEEFGRSRQSISKWVHEFNRYGPDGMIPKWKGHPGTALSDEELEELYGIVQRSPREVGFAQGFWTGKLISAYILKRWKKKVHLRTALRYLEKLGFRRKRAIKSFEKADPKAQEEFSEHLKEVESNRSPRSLTVYVDQGQIWMDALLRWVWSIKGVPAWVFSSSPGKKKISFYVAVVRPLGKVITLLVDKFNQAATSKFLYKLRSILRGWRIDLVWDRATWHKGSLVDEALRENNIHLHLLPAYSPQMNAAESWIRWSKEALSYNTCWGDRAKLVHAFTGFVVSMSKRPEEVLQRCVPKMSPIACQ